MASSAWKMYWKTCYNILQEDKIANRPRLIWNDGHGEWSRAWYWFKDNDDHIGHQYIFK